MSFIFGDSPTPRVAPPPAPRQFVPSPVADPMKEFSRKRLQAKIGKGDREDIFAGFLTDRPPGTPKVLLGG